MYTPLCTHTQYSVLGSTISIEDLIARAKEFNLSHVGISDTGNLFGAVDFFKAATSAGLHPILGMETFLAPGPCTEKKRVPGEPAATSFRLIAKDAAGYRNLSKLSSIGYLEGFYYTPRIDRELLSAHSEGLICLIGGENSPLGFPLLAGDESRSSETLDFFQKTFDDDLYFLLERHPLLPEDKKQSEPWLVRRFEEHVERQKRLESKLRSLATKRSIPLVAGNTAKYLHGADWNDHEILINVQSKEPCVIQEKDSLGNVLATVPNPKRTTLPTHQLYFKSPDEIKELFADLPEAIENTGRIAGSCTFAFDFDQRHYPLYTPPDADSSLPQPQAARAFIENLCEEGIGKRYTPAAREHLAKKFPDKDLDGLIRDRLNYELEIVTSRGLVDYLLIVYDFIHWAKTQGIPVGPGRGSGAGSIILYLIGITDIDPLALNLFFERFINPERPSFPDIDVDICMERRGEVIEYTQNKYGKNNVAQIITFGKMKAKMAIKDVGRVLNVPLPKVNEIAALVPDDLNITLEKALAVEPELKNLCETDPQVRKLMEVAQKLEGAIRNTGIHAAGVIICKDPIMEHVPVCISKDAQMAVTQYAMKPVESVGMLKIDFLGLKTLTSIQKAVDATGKDLDWVNLPLDDAPTFELLNQGKTQGIFQLESGGMRDLAMQLHVDRFEEIIALVALYRPGPMEMIPSFIARKHRKEKIEQDHPLMTDVLAETYGIMVYQEQVMQIASLLAGYSLGEGDVLRRAMGKKDQKEMRSQRKKFCSGAAKHDISEELAGAIFDKIERFASYGFNKSHAAAYGYLSYVTAYLKANFPGEWMASLMTCDRDDTAKVAKFISECDKLGLSILPPDINEAGSEFRSTPSGIRFAMTAIRGVGAGVVALITEERSRNGPFQSLYDFLKRLGPKRVGKKNVELLIDAGAFDSLGHTRDAHREVLDSLCDAVLRREKDSEVGIISLFSTQEQSESENLHTPPPAKTTTPQSQLLQREKELLGFFLTGHPLDHYADLLKTLQNDSFESILESQKGAFASACMIEAVKTKISNRNGAKFAIITLSQESGRIEVPIWPEMYDEYQHLLLEGNFVYTILLVDGRISCRFIRALSDDLNEAPAALKEAEKLLNRKPRKKAMPEKPKASQVLHLHLDLDTVQLSRILQLKALFRDAHGSEEISLHFQRDAQTVTTLHISDPWGVEINEFLTNAVEKIRGITKTYVTQIP